MRRGTALVLAGVLAVGGYLGLDVLDVAPGVFTLAPQPDPAPATPTPTVPVPTLAAPSGMPLAPAGDPAPVPAPATLQAAAMPALAVLSGQVSAVVRDGPTGSGLLADDPDDPLIPASVVKLLSAVAVSTAFPPEAVLTTSAVKDPSAARVYLVAGGDTLLHPGRGDAQAVVGRAGLGDLAAETAAALRGQGVTSVTVAVDGSYAAGPAAAPTWPAGYRTQGITGPVAAIGLSTQRASPGKPGPVDPAAEAGRAFVARLAEQQIAATLDPAPTTAPPGSPVLGAVTSAPVSDQLALALAESDNALTESLTRQAAVRAGGASDFAAAATYVRSVLSGLGVDLTGAALVDASGLSHENRLPARVVADVLTLGASGRAPEVRDVLRRLPVAGLTGTLADRFQDAADVDAAGVARAKTGTLTGVNSLAGTVVTAEGRLLTFTVLHQGPGGTPAAREALDRFVAALAQCGCRP